MSNLASSPTTTACDAPATLSGSLASRSTGLSFKPQHFSHISSHRPDIGFFEVHAENYMVAGGPMHRQLTYIRERYPLSIHGVGLSIGGDRPLDVVHLDRLKVLLDRYQPEIFSEHLAWSSHQGRFLNDLLPVQYTERALQRVCQHVDQTQTHLRRRLLLENPSTYLEYESSDYSEVAFLREVVARTGCGLLLDVTNIHVSCTNHGRDPAIYLKDLPLHAVGEIHLAGFARSTGPQQFALLIDSHDAPVAEEVWTLYGSVLGILGPTPTLIERDGNIPAFEELLAEAHEAAEHLVCVSPAGQKAPTIC